MAIFLVTGVPGSGKTLYTLNYVKSWAERENRAVYYSGIPELTLPWLPLEKGEDWFKVEPNSIVVVDEAQRVFRPRGAGGAVPEHVSKFETHRHLGIDVVLITQHPMLIDTNIRRLIERHFHVKRPFGMQKATVHEFTELKQNPDVNREGSIRHDFKYPRDSFKWYKSAEVHTHKRRLPMRYVFLFLAPFVFAGLVYGVVTHFKNYIFGRPEAIAKAGGVNLASNAPGAGGALINGGYTGPGVSGRQGNVRDDNDWLALQRARIVGLPHTAPVYDKLQSVAAMPTPSACVMSSDRCECYTEQGTRLPAVQDVICRDIVKNGWFDPYAKGKQHQGPSNKAAEQASSSKL